MTEFLCHTDAISAFNQEVYNGLITASDLNSQKKCIKIKDEKYYGYFFKVGLETYFLPHENIVHLPFKVIDKYEVDYKGEVFYVVSKLQPINIPALKAMTFRDLVDTIADFKHTNPTGFLLYKIISIVAYIDRINYRVITPAGFGKDSIVNILSGLVGNTTNLYGATFAKLEYVLKNKFILLNEMGNLKADDMINMQQFLLATGAMFNTYTKRSRASKEMSTLEEYDISKTSIGIVYNPPSYYIAKDQKFFDVMFTEAVINRFIPFYFDGKITTNFEDYFDVTKMVKDNMFTYKKIISTLNYFRENHPTPTYGIDVEFGVNLKRYERSFNTILLYIGEYANDKEEFEKLAMELLDSYNKYTVML